jgi:hypothetical protein
LTSHWKTHGPRDADGEASLGVGEETLTACVKAIRRALGEHGERILVVQIGMLGL